MRSNGRAPRVEVDVRFDWSGVVTRGRAGVREHVGYAAGKRGKEVGASDGRQAGIEFDGSHGWCTGMDR